MPVPIEPLIEDGQFDDAPEDLPIEQAPDPRTGFNHIDEPEAVLDWSDELSEEDEDDLEEDDADFDRAEDEDWEITERGGSASSVLQTRILTIVLGQISRSSITV